MTFDPRPERPTAPAAYGFATGPQGMLPWEQVSQALAAANLYWIGTVRDDGGPHLHSIWGGFVGNHLYFEGGPTTRWARNLIADPRVSFGVESDGLHITGRGVVSGRGAADDFAAVASNYGSKYDYRPENDDFYRVTPEVIIALDMSSLEAFAQSPTRFRFES
ncbi:MAG TPA: pyridoxamine 5'-phosphate oxidase family protein [Acidimicrobiia bacterium]|nr:pyridoxamine 5'-phosphate oxidase family protein [Acidimicrobiia bacterium]